MAHQSVSGFASIADCGYDGPAVLGGGAVPARIFGAWGDYFRVRCDRGEGIARRKAGAFRGRADALVPVTGDFVELAWNPSGESRILSVLPRRSVFERADPASKGRRRQTLAANFDTLFFLMGVDLNFSVRRLERFLAAGLASGAETVVALTKSDLVDPPRLARLLDEVRACAPGVEARAISSRSGDGMEWVRSFARPRRTLAFVGSSGVGKSSLVNALAGEDIMPTCEVRAWDGKGRHATTERELVPLPCGAMVIDTPGMRELALWEADAGLADAFADVEGLFGNCRFSDCRHDTEPGCAVKAALAAGTLTQDRWLAYKRLKAETAREAVRAGRPSAGHRYRK